MRCGSLALQPGTTRSATAQRGSAGFAGIRLSGFRIEVTGDTATVQFQARCDVRGQGASPYYNNISQWSVRLIRTVDGWQVEHAEGHLGFAGLGG